MARALTAAQEDFVGLARVARLATADAGGLPHVVPICPVLDRGKLYVATPGGSKKARNLKANPQASIAFDDYSEDWHGLRGLVISGQVRLIRRGKRWIELRDRLYEKFPQYPEQAPIGSDQVMIELSPDHVAGEI